jgi:ABC-type branched-subunit amino acid transport system substrate-binding protein/outer membrane protein assembly factor BamD (BamD/ComL family)
VQRYPTSAFTDDALLAIGQLATGLGDYQQAQDAHTSLLTNFPMSEHVPIARLELGILQYNTQDYARSQETLHQYLATSSTPTRQAVAHYYLGLIARHQQQYAEALAELQLSVETSTDAVLTEQARAEIEQIIRQHLAGEELEQLTYRYDTIYPGDLLLLQLALFYREARSIDGEIATLERFMTNFPAHPRWQEAAQRLQSLQAASPTVDAAKIGVLLPLSGDGSYFGERALLGIELALATLQEDDSTLQISLVVRDSQGDSLVATEALRALANDEHVIGVIGPLFSQEAIDLTAVADQLGVPFISPYAPEGDFPAASPYAFRNSLTDTLQGRFLAEYAVRGLQLQRFAILYADDAYGISLKEAFHTHVRQLGGEVVAMAAYRPEATEFSQAIKSVGGVDDETLQDLRAGTDMRSSNTEASAVHYPIYDAIFIPGYYDKVALIAPALTFYNITGVQLLGTDGWNTDEILAISDQSVEGAIFVDGFFADSPAPVVQDFVEKFRLRYAKTPDLLAAQAYDTVFILAQALKDGVKTRYELRDALLQVHDFPGVSGTTSFDASGNAAKIPFLLTIQNGRIVQLN